ncbi:hypothetical protein M405DRAFT_321678 [Rhizopogon salebrosus TDB-379]|nr:hypothetical protein M405DRAFT_321678 [Rhizopogon salebrosus TDB-379]
MPKNVQDELNDHLVIQIIDFSLAFRVQDYGPFPETPDIIRAPGFTFYELSNGQVEKEWGLHSDVWSMACMMFGLGFRSMLFIGLDYVYGTMKLVGPLPERWKPYLHHTLGQSCTTSSK